MNMAELPGPIAHVMAACRAAFLTGLLSVVLTTLVLLPGCHSAMHGNSPPAEAGKDAAPAAWSSAPRGQIARPTPSQLAWHDMELGMFIHLAPQTWQDSETDSLKTPLSDINPKDLVAEQWVGVAESMGAKYIVFVAKHEGGFCWWPTETTEHCVRNIPWRDGKGDVLADLSAACRKHGIKLGVYLSPQDRIHGVGIGGKADDPEMQAEYTELFRQQLTEVLSRYGPMVEVWFDGSLVFGVGDILARYAPDAAIFQGPQATIRWVGNEDGIAPDPNWNGVTRAKAGATWGTLTSTDGDPEGDTWLPNECDARSRATWFWKTNNEGTLKSVDQLMDMYDKSVGRGAVLLLNQTPDTTGRIPQADAMRAAEFGAEIRRRFGEPLCETSGRGDTIAIDTPLSPGTAVDTIVLMENIAYGQCVREYVVEAEVGGEWKQIAHGTSIGHKKIDHVAPVSPMRLRWRCMKVVGNGTPALTSFRAYGTAAARR